MEGYDERQGEAQMEPGYLADFDDEVLALEKKIEQEKERGRAAKKRLKFQRRRLDENIAHIISHSYKIMDLREKLRRKDELLARNVQRLKTIEWTLRRDHLIENMCTIAVDLKRAEYLISRGTQRLLVASNSINTTTKREVENTNSVITKLSHKAEGLAEKLRCMKRNYSVGHFSKNILVSTYEGALQVILAAMTALLERSIARVTEQEKVNRLRASTLEKQAREIREQAERYRNEYDEFLRKKLQIKFSNAHMKICYVNFGAL